MSPTAVTNAPSENQRDALAALLRSKPRSGSKQPIPPKEPQQREEQQAITGTPKPMPFDPEVPPTKIQPFTLASTSKTSSQPPRKRIVTTAHLSAFLSSQTHSDLLSFLRQGAASITGVPIPADVTTPQASSSSASPPQNTTGVKAVLALLSVVASILDAHPPRSQNAGGSTGSGSASAQGRFGNPTFRDFYNEVTARSEELHSSFFPALADREEDEETLRAWKKMVRVELKAYFDESWGNARRIDYGSGMELNLVCWLLMLYKLGLFNESSSASNPIGHISALVPLSELGPDLFLRVFWSYILLMRRIQATYFLEPAGSHGVWGLDDYHFLPFLLGAAQLSNHPYLRPSSIHAADVMSPPSKYPSEYMYLSQIALLHSIKTIPGGAGGNGGPSPNSLRWHSPMLDDISSVKSWAQVEKGMWKMLEAEVVGKLPVAQHFLFGQILPFPASFAADEQDGEYQQRHLTEVDDDACCGGGAHSHAPSHSGSVKKSVVLDAQGKPLPVPTGHSHAHASVITNNVDAPQQGGTTGWGDCCGIPVPSAYGAAANAALVASAKEGAASSGGSGHRVVAETGQLGRAKGWSSSPAAQAGASSDAAALPAKKLPVVAGAGASGIRRIPFD
ncbi:Serine/threonine-protein phosphatase 2A activator 2 [Tilletia horrida]|uniref:Serine/threonine-protein phosphatase 2A activator n=1 Tax=Tilletia horrida TaxID=155126 RepID=A0AAN6GVU9_9BASI|nr:Serine/threonine-protein phosphatase 2A activator 2 [Tilletia horrida]